MIEDYDFDKDGKLNMAEFKQYLTESEEGAEKVEEEEKQEEQETEDEEVFVTMLYFKFLLWKSLHNKLFHTNPPSNLSCFNKLYFSNKTIHFNFCLQYT